MKKKNLLRVMRFQSPLVYIPYSIPYCETKQSMSTRDCGQVFLYVECVYRQIFNTLHSVWHLVLFLLLAEYFRSAFSKVAYLYLALFNKQCLMHDAYSVIEYFRSAFQKFFQIKHHQFMF